MTRFIVYGLSDPRTGEIRYIGKSSSGMTRPRGHSRPSVLAKDGNRYKKAWLDSLSGAGLKYEIQVIGEFASHENLDKHEIWAIAYARAIGLRLTNLTDGGEGVLNPPESVRKKISAAQKGRKHPPRTAEWLKNQSAALSGIRRPYMIERNKSAEMRTAVRDSKLGKKRAPLSDEWRNKIRLAMIGRPISEKSRQAIIARNTGRKFSNETKAKMANARREWWTRHRAGSPDGASA